MYRKGEGVQQKIRVDHHHIEMDVEAKLKGAHISVKAAERMGGSRHVVGF